LIRAVFFSVPREILGNGGAFRMDCSRASCRDWRFQEKPIGMFFAESVPVFPSSPISTGVINMQDKFSLSRRSVIKLGAAALAMIPVVALAAKNDAMRTSTKYKDTPEGDKSCANCLQFVPGKSAADLGGCKIYPGDTEVSPKGFCIAWAKKA
jgi:hypothetical protein